MQPTFHFREITIFIDGASSVINRYCAFRQLCVFLLLAFVLFGGAWITLGSKSAKTFDVYYPPIPELPADVARDTELSENSAIQWLRDNTHVDLSELSSTEIHTLQATRPKAALIALVRNAELEGMVESVKQVEARFNSRMTHRYDWIFFNNEKFTDDFKSAMTNATDSRCYFETISPEHWSIPSWIDQSRFDIGRQYMGDIGVGKAWLQSYHHMCRWNSAAFAWEERLLAYDYYWRVEPDVSKYTGLPLILVSPYAYYP